MATFDRDHDAQGAGVEGAHLTGDRLVDGNPVGATLADAKFSGARFVHADFSGARFVGTNFAGAGFLSANLAGARFVGADLTEAVLRGVEVRGAEIDAPWLADGSGVFLVNGVNVVPTVEAELDRRFPGRAERRASDPDGLRAAWTALETTWAATIKRVASMPSGAVDVSVAGEWSFAQTLRHLIMATDTWLGKAILRRERPYHRYGLANAEAADDGLDMSVFTAESPTYAQVLDARADRVGMVRDYLAEVDVEELSAQRSNPWAPDHPETVLSCLHTILDEEWEHHRYAVRDLGAIEASYDG